MSELRCKKCGIERSFAGAAIADRKRTCGSDDEPAEVVAGDGSVKYSYAGEKHDWEYMDD